MEESRRITHISFLLWRTVSQQFYGWLNVKNFYALFNLTHGSHTWSLAVFPKIYLWWLRCGSIHKILEWQEEAPEHDTTQPCPLYHPNPTDLYCSNHTWTNLDLLYWKYNYHKLWERCFSVSNIGSSEGKIRVHNRNNRGWTYDLMVTIIYYHSRIMHNTNK